MALRSQIHPFPEVGQYDRGWSNDLSAVLGVLQGGLGVNQGLRLGIPTSGLIPTATDGYLVQGDEVMQPNMSDLITAAPASATMRKCFLGGSDVFYWADAANAAKGDRHILVAETSTSANAIKAIGQRLNYGGGHYGLRGVVNLAAADKGADTNLATWLHPEGQTGSFIRIEYAAARVLTAAASGGDTAFKMGGVTLATILAANTGTANFTVVGSPGATWILAPNTDLTLKYNAAGTPTAGVFEFHVGFHYL